MSRRTRIALLAGVGLVLGSVAAFFLVAASLFADGAATERLIMLAVAIGVFAVLGAVLGRFAGGAWLPVALALVVPSILFALVFGDEAVMTAAFAFCTVAAGIGAAALAARTARAE